MNNNARLNYGKIMCQKWMLRGSGRGAPKGKITLPPLQSGEVPSSLQTLGLPPYF